jgi:TorA maturation chaperone TorD
VSETDPALLRSRVYGLLRRVFLREVDEALLDWCREQNRLGLWSDLELDLDEVLEDSDPEAVVEQLAVDFCQLFLISGAIGSPHESLHVEASSRGGSAKPFLMGDPAVAVKRLYREAGFALEEDAHQMPDALCVEFEFMERLSQEEAAAREESRSEDVQRLQELQRRMLGEHLARWVPDYGREQKTRAETGFYRAMLELAADFVEWDNQERGLRGEATRPATNPRPHA